MQRHLHLVVALGAMEQGLTQKMQAYMHTVRVESLASEDVAECLPQTCSRAFCMCVVTGQYLVDCLFVSQRRCVLLWLIRGRLRKPEEGLRIRKLLGSLRV